MSVTDQTAAVVTSIARLEALGTELDPAGWRTRPEAEPGRAPFLRVQNPQPGAAMLSDYIYCAPGGDAWTYWWSWAEPSCANTAEAAAIISKVLRAAEPAHSHGGQPGTGTAAQPGRMTQAAPARAGMPDGRGVTGHEVRL